MTNKEEQTLIIDVVTLQDKLTELEHRVALLEYKIKGDK